MNGKAEPSMECLTRNNITFAMDGATASRPLVKGAGFVPAPQPNASQPKGGGTHIALGQLAKPKEGGIV